MKKRVEILQQKVVLKRSFFRIIEAKVCHELYNGGMSDELTRLNFERGDSAAALIHDKRNDRVIFTEQFRFPTYEKGPGWLLEIPAGSVETDEAGDPKLTIKRELMEEIGYEISRFRKVYTFYVTPGGSSERIHLYYATAKKRNRKSKGGGLEGTGEDIRVVSMKVAKALKKIETGDIVDAKTIIALQWLQLRRVED